MSQENVEIVQASFAHFVANGAPDWETIDENVEIYDHDISLDASEYHGHAGYGRWLENWAEAFSEYSVEAEEFIDAPGDRVVVILRMKATGRGSGVTLDRQDAIVTEMRDRKGVRVDYYNNRSEALKAVGLEE
ncbi:MAG TPA: nuclear transport factor 2 family protein [Solirubrobacteraceae bacterium]|jgi:ketosteroid isomerase-like protein|nr:nuclear transport factor 2 family protein [Solirubrobacteraceae bacterium]